MANNPLSIRVETLSKIPIITNRVKWCLIITTIIRYMTLICKWTTNRTIISILKPKCGNPTPTAKTTKPTTNKVSTANNPNNNNNSICNNKSTCKILNKTQKNNYIWLKKIKISTKPLPNNYKKPYKGWDSNSKSMTNLMMTTLKTSPMKKKTKTKPTKKRTNQFFSEPNRVFSTKNSMPPSPNPKNP